jgi:hypothetical protein
MGNRKKKINITKKRLRKTLGGGCGPSKMGRCSTRRHSFQEAERQSQHEEEEEEEEEEEYEDGVEIEPSPEPSPVIPDRLTIEQLEDLRAHLIPVKRKKKGKHYYFDNFNNGRSLRYTMETGIYNGEEDFREPSFRDIKLLYKTPLTRKCHECRTRNPLGVEGCECGRLRLDEEGNFYDWRPYHQDPGVRESATFRIYKIDPKFIRKSASRFLSHGKVHGKETNAGLAFKVSKFL